MWQAKDLRFSEWRRVKKSEMRLLKMKGLVNRVHGLSKNAGEVEECQIGKDLTQSSRRSQG
jgi:hypothetical protein